MHYIFGGYVIHTLLIIIINTRNIGINRSHAAVAILHGTGVNCSVHWVLQRYKLRSPWVFGRYAGA